MACLVPPPSFRRCRFDKSDLIPRPLKRSKNASVPAKDEQQRLQQCFPKPPLPPKPLAKRRLHKVSQQKGNPFPETASHKGCDLQKGNDPSVGHPLLNERGPKEDNPIVANASPLEGVKGFDQPMEGSKPMDVDEKERKIKSFSFVNGEGEMDYPFQPRPSGFECKEDEELAIAPDIFVHGVTPNGQEFKKMDIWKFKYADGTFNIWVKGKLHEWWELGEPSDSYKEFLLKNSYWRLSTDVAIGANSSSKFTLRINISKDQEVTLRSPENEVTQGINLISFLSIGHRKNLSRNVRAPRQVIFDDED